MTYIMSRSSHPAKGTTALQQTKFKTAQEPPQPPEQPAEPQPDTPAPTPTPPAPVTPPPQQPPTPPEYPVVPEQTPTPPPVEIPGAPVAPPALPSTPVEIPPAPGETPSQPDPDSPLPVTTPPMGGYPLKVHLMPEIIEKIYERMAGQGALPLRDAQNQNRAVAEEDLLDSFDEGSSTVRKTEITRRGH